MNSDLDIPVVVVGGYEYSETMNQPPTVTVRELARRHRVLNLLSEAHGSVLRRLQGRARHLDGRAVARTVLDSTRARRVEERLWLAPVRGLSAVGPLWAPEAMRRRNIRVFSRVIRAWLDEIGEQECLLLFYWWALPELLETVPHVASIYDCTDEHAALPGAITPSSKVSRLEGLLLDAVDRSYVVSAGLLEARRRPERRIEVLPNGFDEALFRRLQSRGFTVPEALRMLPRPIVGYAGGIGARMDWELLAELARRRPDWSFAFVGGEARAAPAVVRERSNVFFQHSLPYPAALGAISHFDAAIIPARVGQFSVGNSFLKLLDYFAHGLPVVATPLPDTIGVTDTAAGLLQLAEGVDGWIEALSAALAEPPSSPLRAARLHFVQERSAERRVARMLGDALG